LLTADSIDAEMAERFGLVNKVVDLDVLLEEAKALVVKIASKSPSAVNKIFKCVNDFYKPNVNGMQREIYEFGEAFGTADFQEGTEAFMNKRKADFRNL
jgi:enoyl-CoA hydratase